MSAGGTATNSADAGENLKADVAEIQRALTLLCHPNEVYELRALGTSKGTVSGYFDSLEKLTRNAAECSDRFSASGVYITLNPVKGDLLARACSTVPLMPLNQYCFPSPRADAAVTIGLRGIAYRASETFEEQMTPARAISAAQLSIVTQTF
jgi:hypothetical protein